VITIGATGHQNIPYEAVTFVEEGIANVISHADQQPAGVSLLAAGAGQLFAKALLGAGGRLHVILFRATATKKPSLSKRTWIAFWPSYRKRTQ
jgi:hypothetical protein